jgi:hypothetical protein
MLWLDERENPWVLVYDALGFAPRVDWMAQEVEQMSVSLVEPPSWIGPVASLGGLGSLIPLHFAKVPREGVCRYWKSHSNRRIEHSLASRRILRLVRTSGWQLIRVHPRLLESILDRY